MHLLIPSILKKYHNLVAHLFWVQNTIGFYGPDIIIKYEE